MVDERLQAVSLTADAEFWAASLQGGSRKQDEFCKGQNTVVFDFLGSSLGLADLLSHSIGGLEKINLALYGGSVSRP